MKKLENLYGLPVTIATREMVESDASKIVDPALSANVGFLVVGDPVCATTHTDIMIRARSQNIQIEVIHNASVMGAVGSCGLQLYSFGATISLPFFTEGWKPTSFYKKMKYNFEGGMHTLCLLDIKVREPDFQAMAKGKEVYLPPRYMTVNTALEQLVESEGIENPDAKEEDRLISTEKTLVVGLARLGQHDQKIACGTISELLEVDFGGPLHCMIVAAGDTTELELEALRPFFVEGSKLTPVERVEH